MAGNAVAWLFLFTGGDCIFSPPQPGDLFFTTELIAYFSFPKSPWLEAKISDQTRTWLSGYRLYR